MTHNPSVLHRVAERVSIISINRSDRHNALDHEAGKIGVDATDGSAATPMITTNPAATAARAALRWRPAMFGPPRPIEISRLVKVVARRGPVLDLP